MFSEIRISINVWCFKRRLNAVMRTSWERKLDEYLLWLLYYSSIGLLYYYYSCEMWSVFESLYYIQGNKKTLWPESASELYRLSDRSLSAKLVPTSADRGCHVVSVTDPYGRILGFIDRSRYFSSSSSSIILRRLSGPRSRPITSQKIW
jgi:hypothetical protein